LNEVENDIGDSVRLREILTRSGEVGKLLLLLKLTKYIAFYAKKLVLKRKEQRNDRIGKYRKCRTMVTTRAQGMSMENFRNKTYNIIMSNKKRKYNLI
jgi:hypothetical protein